MFLNVFYILVFIQFSFFINHSTKETTWTDPRLNYQQQSYGGYQQQQPAYQQQQQQQQQYQRQQQQQQHQQQQQAAQALSSSTASSSGGYQMSSVSQNRNVSTKSNLCIKVPIIVSFTVTLT